MISKRHFISTVLLIFSVSFFSVSFVPASVLAEFGSDLPLSRRAEKRAYNRSCKKVKRTLEKIKLSESQQEDAANLIARLTEEAQLTLPFIKSAARDLVIKVNEPQLTFDPQPVIEAYRKYVDLGENLVVLRAEVMDGMSRILTAEQYEDLVRAKAHLYACAVAPLRIVDKQLGDFVDKHKTTD